MDNAKSYEQLMQITTDAAVRIDAVYQKAISRKITTRGVTSETTDLAFEYARAMNAIMQAAASARMLQPYIPYMGCTADGVMNTHKEDEDEEH